MKSFLIPCLAFFLIISLPLFAVVSAEKPADSDALIRKANQLHDSGYYQPAINLLKQVSPVDPNYPWACYEMALSFYHSDNKELALQKCREAEFQGYDHPYLYSMTGSILDDLGRTNEALVLLRKAFTKWPYNQNIMYNLGLCYLNAGKPDSAEIVLTRSIVFYPYHTRSHLVLSRANYAMGRITESYLALSMAILINPGTSNIREFENTIGGKTGFIPRAYLYPYPATADRAHWDGLKYLLQSELAFNKDFNFPYKLDFTFTRQSYLLFSNLRHNPADTSLYNRLYARLFSEIYRKGMFETYINYCMNNISNPLAQAWNSKNSGKIDGLISWAQQFLDQGRIYGYLQDNEKIDRAVHHFNDAGVLSGIGEQTGTERIRNGVHLVITDEGAVSEKGNYVNDESQGEYLVYHPDGRVKQKLNFVNNQLNGTIFTFYPDGSKQWIYPFVAGKKTGITEEYSSGGMLTGSNTLEADVYNGPGVNNNYSEGYTREFNYVNDTLTGKMTEQWLNGQSKLESTFEKEFNNGAYKSWYPTGKPESEGTYTAGVKTGRWVNYHSNGKVMDEAEMNDQGNYYGEYRTFDRQGKLATSGKEYTNGVLTGSFIRYFLNGQKQVVQTYVSDTLQKVESFDVAGNLLYSVTASDDSVYYKSFYADGTLFQEGWLVAGNNEGNWKKYNPQGILIEDLNYLKGLQSGPQKKYYGNGNLKEEFSCDSSFIIGPYKSYYINGTVQTIGNYLKDGADGEWISYHRNDSVESKYFYNQGVLCGRNMTYNPDGKLVSEVFYNDKGKAVRTIDYDRYGKITDDYRYDFGKHEFTTYYSNGKLKSVIRICDNVKHGLQEKYFPNGQLKSQITYLYGKPHGKHTRYDYRGSLEMECNYTLGELDGEYKLYHEGLPDYQMFFENGLNNGRNTGYHHNGKIAREINMENDERNGFSDYYAPDGTFMYRVRYQNNAIQGISWKNSSGGFVPETLVNQKTSQVIAYYPNGKMSASIYLKNGLYHGKFVSWYPDGKPLRESEYLFDENTGVTKTYYPNGRLLQVATYLNDELNGPYTTYYPNGKIKLTGSYTAQNEHGEWHAYDESGRETETLFYHYGDLYDLVKK